MDHQQEGWKNEFPTNVLRQGKEYYLAGKAKKLAATDTGYSAVVRGTRNYQVEIEADGDEVYDMTCTCPDAADGSYCKHMAAVLFLIEEMYGTLYFSDEEAGYPEPPVQTNSVPAGKKSAGPDLTLPLSHEEKREKQTPAVPARPRFVQLEELQAEGRRHVEEQWDPGLDQGRQEYRYFHYEAVTRGLNITDSARNAANEFIRSGNHSAIQMRYGFREGDEEVFLAEGILNGRDARYYTGWQARVILDSDRLLDASCSNYACYTRTDKKSYLGRTLCVHELAALLMTLKEIKEKNPGDTTNSSGHKLLNVLRGISGEHTLNRKTQVQQVLEPYLIRNEFGELSASFRIGAGKLYKIKRIPDTLENIREHQEEQFGSKTLLQMGREYLTEDSLPWLDFLENVTEEEKQLQQYISRGYRYNRYYTPVPQMTDSVPLFGEKLDSFFEIALASGKPVEFTDKKTDQKKQLLYFRDSNISATLEIKEDTDVRTGQLNGILIQGSVPELIAGVNAGYYFQDNCLNRISRERQKELEPLAGTARNGTLQVRIGRKELPDFYRKMLPRLREIAQITEIDPERINACLPPDAQIICYLDLEADMIVCRADACYGTTICLLGDWIDPKARETVNRQPFRDEAAEREVLEILLRYLPGYDPQLRVFFCERESEMLYDFLSEGLNLLMDVCEVRGTERFRRLRVRRKIKVNVGVSVENNLMDLSLTSQDLTEDELLDVLFHYTRKRRFLRLKNGDFLQLDENETIQQLARMMETLHISPREFVRGKMQIPAYRALYLDKMMEQTQDVYASRDSRFKRLIKEFKTVEDADYEVPAAVKDILRKYQIAGYRWLRTLDAHGFGGILADDMGLGKTLQVIAVLLADRLESETLLPVPDGQTDEIMAGSERKRHPEKTDAMESLPAASVTKNGSVPDAHVSLVVCPASLVYNWGEELHRFAPQLKVSLIVGTQKERAALIHAWQDSDVLVTSYDLLKRDIAEYEGKQFRFAVIDEAQYIKNHTTAAAKAVKLIRAATRYALTGTPIENRLSEMWSIFDFLMPGFLYEYETFRSSMELPITKYEDEEAREHLRRMVAPFILRRLKQDVLQDLPEKLEEVRYAKMEKKQQKLYDGQVVYMRNEISGQEEADFRKNKIQILAELMRIRQICCDPSLCFSNYDGGSAKREACLDLIRSLTESGHKALLFSQFTSMLELLEQDLEKENISYYKITGATPKERRSAMVKAFNEDETPVFLISLKAGGTGLNLTGADVVIHYDPWWNLAVQNQATDRAHRIGQTKVVTVYKMIVKGTIEEKITEIQETKRQLADDILSGEAVSSSVIERDDLLALLE